MRKKVFICSPLRGDFVQNRRLAERYCHAAFLAGYRPFAPHVFYTRFLNDMNPEERKAGIQAGIEDLSECHELWVFLPPGVFRPSEGMQQEIDQALAWGILVRYATLSENGTVGFWTPEFAQGAA